MKNLQFLNNDMEWLIRYLSIHDISKPNAHSLIQKIVLEMTSSFKREISKEEGMEFLLSKMQDEVSKIKELQFGMRIKRLQLLMV